MQFSAFLEDEMAFSKAFKLWNWALDGSTDVAQFKQNFETFVKYDARFYKNDFVLLASKFK